MHSFRHTFRFALFMAAALTAHAGELYKSVDAAGRVTFSDTPPTGAVTVQRIATSESAKEPGRLAETGSAPIYLALVDGLDAAVAQANAKVDLAEHALANARSALLGHDPLALHSSRLSRSDTQQLEFFKRDVQSARRQLIRVLQQRQALATRPLA
jgi:hypothetical protein